MPPNESAVPMVDYNRYREPLLTLRDLLPRLRDLLHLDGVVSSEAWQNLDARLLPLLDPDLPLMVAVCGGANSGKSTLFNSLLRAVISPVRADAGYTRRVLAAVHPEVTARENFMANLFAPFGRKPAPLGDPKALTVPGPPLYRSHPDVPHRQVWMDTPDFDTGSDDRYLNRDIAREVLEACNVLIYIVTNTTYNNLENTRFMRRMLTESGLRKCVLVYSCSRTFTDRQVMDHLQVTARNLLGEAPEDVLIGCYRTDTSDEVAANRAFMQLRPVRPEDPGILELLRRMDPREVREVQIISTLAALTDYIRSVLQAAERVRDEVDLYAGMLRLVLFQAVRQGLAAVPIEKILRRMNNIWLETGPTHLKLFRGVGRLVGKPARLIYFLVNSVQGKETSETRTSSPQVDPLEQIRSNLLGAAAELRDRILAEEVLAETTAQDPQGQQLIALVDRIRLQAGDAARRLPFRQATAATGAVALNAAAPACTRTSRQRLGEQSWSDTVELVTAAAPEVLNISEDRALNRELTALVNEFRGRMGILQKTRESFFASLNLLPATLGIAYILTTGDPVGAGGIYAKLHGLFGVHDLWALVTIPASAGLDRRDRQRLSEMLEPVVKGWLENRALIVRDLFEKAVSGEVRHAVERLTANATGLIDEVQHQLNVLEERVRLR
jgi:GTPase SAR1 family protein